MFVRSLLTLVCINPRWMTVVPAQGEYKDYKKTIHATTTINKTPQKFKTIHATTNDK